MIRTGAVDQDIDSPPFIFNLRDHVLGRHWVSNIASECQRLSSSLGDVLRRCLGLGFAGSITEGDLPMPCGQVKGDTATDAFRSAGDECNELVHGGSQLNG